MTRTLTRKREYDLLAAALIGITVGAGTMYFLRGRSRSHGSMRHFFEGIGRGAAWAGKRAARLSGKGARWAAGQGEALWERVPRDEIRDHLSDYMDRAREAIDDAVDTEVHDLKKFIRQQRKRLCD